jgi:anti-sigma regulatory factor (Ser/Thr protein kinase)
MHQPEERNPVSNPVGRSALSSEEEHSSSPVIGAGDEQASYPRNPGVTVWDTVGPLTPVILSETERRFRFRGLPQAVGAARRSLREWEDHFEPELFYDISLCVSELVTKSVQNAEPGEVDEIELGVFRNEQLVRAEVTDRRTGVTVSAPPAMDCEDWGMFIVGRVADRWGVDRAVGTRVWCEIDLAGSQRVESPVRRSAAPRSDTRNFFRASER